MTLLLTTSSRRSRYLAGFSSSRRSGNTTDSLGSWRELFLDAFDPGVAGVRDPCLIPRGSELFLSRLSPSRSPKLFRPVDEDVRVVGGASRSSIDVRPRELIVEDRPRRCKCDLVGDEWPEFLESDRNSAVAGEGLDFWNMAFAGDTAVGVATPFLELGRDWVGVCRPV